MTSMAEIMFNALSMAGNYNSRMVDRTEVDGLTVSTAFTSDCGYETAIGDSKGFHPVERYYDKDEAKKGHAKWCQDIVGKTKITQIEYLDWDDAEEIELVRK